MTGRRERAQQIVQRHPRSDTLPPDDSGSDETSTRFQVDQEDGEAVFKGGDKTPETFRLGTRPNYREPAVWGAMPVNDDCLDIERQNSGNMSGDIFDELVEKAFDAEAFYQLVLVCRKNTFRDFRILQVKAFQFSPRCQHELQLPAIDHVRLFRDRGRDVRWEVEQVTK